MKSSTIILALVVISYYGISEIKKPHIIELTKDGFYPSKININIGETIIFKSKVKEFWPASDPHPSHNNLVDFDPMRPIKINESWKYKFNQAGIWAYHDHVNTTHRGEITVNADGGNYKIGISDTKKCENEESCILYKIKKTVEDKGVEEAFSLFSETYKSKEETPGCHWTSHFIGEIAAEKVLHGGDFQITPATAYCNYGFYHGFMEKLLREDPNLNKAINFCAEAGRKISNQAKDNCLHGIGHGFTEDPPHISIWGNGKAMAKPGLSVCENLFSKLPNELSICATGVYNVMAGFLYEGKYGLLINKGDPFEFCKTQDKKYDIACFGEFAARLDSLTNWDISKLHEFIKDIENKTVKDLTVWVASSAMMQRDVEKDDHSNYINGCHELNEDLIIVCIRGVVHGLIVHGEPNREEEKAIKFCSSLNKNEEGACYRELIENFKRIYPGKRTVSLCEEIKNKAKYIEC